MITSYHYQELATTLFEEMGDGLFVFDPKDERLLDVNPMALRLTRFTADDLLGRPVTELFRSEPDAGIQGLRQALRHTQTFHSQENFYLRQKADFSWVPVNLTITRLHTEDQVLGLIMVRDITARKRAEEAIRLANTGLEARVRQRTAALKENEERLRLITNNVPGLIAYVDRDERIRFLNDVFTNWYGLPVQDQLGKTLSEVLPRAIGAEASARARPHFAAVLGNGQPVTYENVVRRADGSVATVLVKLVPRCQDGKIMGFYVLVTDISERQRAEERLRLSEERFRELAERVHVIPWEADCTSARFTYVGPQAEAILGYPTAAWHVPGFWQAHIHPEDRERVLKERVERAKQRDNYELDYRLVAADGRVVWVHDIVHVVRNGGQPVRQHGLLIDVTERQRLAEQLAQVQKLEAIGQLAAGVAHDFNNLLTVILGNVGLLHADLPPDHPHQKLTAEIERAGSRAAELTRQLLGFSRRSLLQLRPVRLDATVTETVTILRRSFDSNITIEVQVDPDLWTVRADSTQIGQVLLNLCLNARDAMPAGGQLRLEVGNRTFDERAPGAGPGRRTGDFVFVRVQDTGHGMSAEARSRIFEPFFTTKPVGKGTGLGLPMALGILQQHEGWIDCASEVGRGTTFTCYLPRWREPAPAASPPPAPTQPPAAASRAGILLADDEPMIRDLGRNILEQHGFQVFLADDGQQAIEVYRQQGNRIDLVILDLTMPVLSGQSARERLTQLNPQVRILFSTGYSHEQTTDLNLPSVVGVLTKPYTPQELLGKVHTALAAARQ